MTFLISCQNVNLRPQLHVLAKLPSTECVFQGLWEQIGEEDAVNGGNRWGTPRPWVVAGHWDPLV